MKFEATISSSISNDFDKTGKILKKLKEESKYKNIVIDPETHRWLWVYKEAQLIEMKDQEFKEKIAAIRWKSKSKKSKQSKIKKRT